MQCTRNGHPNYKINCMGLNIFKDARYFQIIFQCLFLCYGIYYLQWNAEWWLYTTYLGTSLGTQLLVELIRRRGRLALRDTGWVKSAIISSMGLCLLLKTNHWYIAALAALVSILSKYFITFRRKHIFNPSALGIAVAVWLTGDAWVSPGQWGSGIVLLFGVVCLGFIVVSKVQKLDVSLAFLGTFTGLLFLRQVVYQGWPADYFIQSVSTGSLLLFSFFMITDPKTTPDHPVARILWSMSIAAVAFYLAAFKFMNATPIWVLVCAQPLVPVLDYLFKAKRFDWQGKVKTKVRQMYPSPVSS